MTKADLVGTVAATAGTTAADAERVLNSFRDVVQAKLRAGEDVSYPGLGKFSRVQRKARTGRNPQTGATIKVKASKAPKFTPAAGLKSIVNGESAAPRIKSK